MISKVKYWTLLNPFYRYFGVHRWCNLIVQGSVEIFWLLGDHGAEKVKNHWSIHSTILIDFVTVNQGFSNFFVLELKKTDYVLPEAPQVVIFWPFWIPLGKPVFQKLATLKRVTTPSLGSTRSWITGDSDKLVSWFVQTPPSKNRPFHNRLICFYYFSKRCALSGGSLYASLSEFPVIHGKSLTIHKSRN